MFVWLGIIVGFLLIGLIGDYIVKKRNINIDPDEGIKHVSDSEAIYVETHLDTIKNNQQNNL